MRLVRLNWVAKGQTITDESSGIRAHPSVRELSPIWRLSHSKNTHLYLVRDTRSEFLYTRRHAAPTSLRIFFLSLSPPPFSFSLSLFNIQEDRARILLFLTAGINTLNLFSLYTSGSSGNAISLFGIHSSRAENEETPRKPRKEIVKRRSTLKKKKKCSFSSN